MADPKAFSGGGPASIHARAGSIFFGDLERLLPPDCIWYTNWNVGLRDQLIGMSMNIVHIFSFISSQHVAQQHLDGQFLRKLPKSSHNNTQHQYQVDLDYIETDDEGWTYAIAFPRLQYYLSRKKSHGKPKKTHCVRRRRWLRQAKPAAMVPVSEAETI